DATGNRTQRTTTSLTTSDATDTQSLTYASDSNRLTSVNGSTLPMDAAGNHTQINGRRFTYDSQGRLSEVYQANIYKIADYKYNALGQRIIKRAYVMGSQALAGTTTYLYDSSGKLLGQTFYDGNGQKTSGQYWFWLDNMPLAQLTTNFSALGEVSSSKLIYLHVDHLNTPRLATDSSQTLLWRWNSDAYGVVTPEEDVDGDGKATTIALRFPGQIYDAQTQLSYNYHRDYNPDTGRYVQSDPIGLGGGLNTFGYVSANPLRWSDPRGLAPWDWNGRGNTGVCSYYEQRVCETTGDLSDYYKRAEDICKGEDRAVNSLLTVGIASAWIRGTTNLSESDIYNKIRAELISNDKNFSSNSGPNGVTGDMIDAYHNDVFRDVGIGPLFYGGNLWPQGIPPNPVPRSGHN
ncbi:RHS repeat-associated core domain-containing protein, partial [Pseudomonas syringae]